MNDIMISGASSRVFEELLESKREKYPRAFSTNTITGKSFFFLGDYIVNYCMDEETDYCDWIEFFMQEGRPFISNSAHSIYGITFFDYPREVQEGLLIALIETCNNGSFDTTYSSIDLENELLWTKSLIAEFFLKDDSSLKGLLGKEYEEALCSLVEDWECDMSYGYCENCGIDSSTWSVKSGEELLFMSQLIAYMGLEVKITDVMYDDDEASASRVLLYSMAQWECLKEVRLTKGDIEYDKNGVNITINSSQKYMTGESAFSKYIHELVNNPFYKKTLETFMEDFSEYFPSRRQELPVETYSRF